MQCVTEKLIESGAVLVNPCSRLVGWITLWNFLDPFQGRLVTPGALIAEPGNCACVISLFFNMKSALEVSKHHFPTPFTRNNCRDAMRHSYFNALNTIDCGEDLAHAFGDAHEEGQIASNSVEMDIFNNEQGRLVALIDLSMDDNMTEDYICNWLASGNMQILEDPFNDGSMAIPSLECICQ